MDCINCKNKFYVKRNFYSLFSTKKYYLCNRCYQDNPIKPNLEILDGILIINLLKRKPKYSYDVYFSELAFIIKRYLFSNEYFVIFLEELYLSMKMVEFINWLSEISDKQVMIICFLKLN